MICRVSSDCPLRNFNYVQIVIEIAGKRFFFSHGDVWKVVLFIYLFLN